MKLSYCYANSLDDCAGKITGEHVISQSILSDMVETLIKGVLKVIGKNSLVVNNLCKHHNNFLSDFEAEFIKYKDFLVKDAHRFNTIRKSPAIPEPESCVIDGKSIEVWFLKSAINKLFQDYKSEEVYSMIDFPFLVQRMFGVKNFEYPFGLSYFQLPEQLTESHYGELTFVYHVFDNLIYGITVNFQARIFFLCFPTPYIDQVMERGIEFEGKTFKFYKTNLKGEAPPANEYLLMWHTPGMRTTMPNSEGTIVKRSVCWFNWAKNAE